MNLFFSDPYRFGLPSVARLKAAFPSENCAMRPKSDTAEAFSLQAALHVQQPRRRRASQVRLAFCRGRVPLLREARRGVGWLGVAGVCRRSLCGRMGGVQKLEQRWFGLLGVIDSFGVVSPTF